MPVKTSLARARNRRRQNGRAAGPGLAKSLGISSASNHQTKNISISSETMAACDDGPPMIPDVFLNSPPIVDDLITKTSRDQERVCEECQPFLAGFAPFEADFNPFGVPHLNRERHINFLRKYLATLPAPYYAADASRPWMFYWCLNGMSLLGKDVSPYRRPMVETARSIQNPTGGFGGGFGQYSHLATTYATVLALAIVGGEDAYDVIDRRSMWRWLSQLKQKNGGFAMSIGGEVDVRGAYCAAVIITLLGLPLDLASDSPAWTEDQPQLFTGLAEYVRRCQTFEGGISGKPDAEAHGAYAFCALGCLAIIDTPSSIFPRYLDMPKLISWLSSRQYAPEGGFSGRTNKLVDGCYSHWVGACWPLIDASMTRESTSVPDPAAQTTTSDTYDFYSREGLIRYILSCGQDHTRRGGMRDKPSANSDAYHTCYVLSGLSSAQHTARLIATDEGGSTAWNVSPHVDNQIFDEQDRVEATDPVYAIPQRQRDLMMAYFLSKPGF